MWTYSLGLVCHWSSEWTAVVGLWTFWFSPSIFEYSLLCSGHWILGVIHWKTFWPLTLCGPFDNTTIAHTLIKGGKFVTLHKSRAFIELPFFKSLTNICARTLPDIWTSKSYVLGQVFVNEELRKRILHLRKKEHALLFHKSNCLAEETNNIPSIIT